MAVTLGKSGTFSGLGHEALGASRSTLGYERRERVVPRPLGARLWVFIPPLDTTHYGFKPLIRFWDPIGCSYVSLMRELG
eukprot:scaffold13215_cov120-Isochrysis_galbana.AAC.4